MYNIFESILLVYIVISYILMGFAYIGIKSSNKTDIIYYIILLLSPIMLPVVIYYAVKHSVKTIRL